MNNIIEAADLPEGEKIYLKKSKIFNEWAVVHPIKNKDGSVNWFNLLIGSWGNLEGVLLIILMTAIFYFAYQEVSAQTVSCLETLRLNNPISNQLNLLTLK